MSGPSGNVKVSRKYYDKDNSVITEQQFNTKYYTYELKNSWYAFETFSNSQFDGKYWFYLNDNGQKVTGWQLINNKWYYFDPDEGIDLCGYMETGWIYINGTSTTIYGFATVESAGKYYCRNLIEMGSYIKHEDMYKEDCTIYGLDYDVLSKEYEAKVANKPELKAGWSQNSDGIWFYSDDLGRSWYNKGWKKIDGIYYYFYDTGAMAICNSIDGLFLGKDGKCEYTGELDYLFSLGFHRNENGDWEIE